MKKAELEKLIAEAIDNSGYLHVEEDRKILSEIIVKEIADKLIIKRVLIVDGSIDSCPEFEIETEEEFRKSSGNWTAHENGEFRAIKENESIEAYYNEYTEWASEDDYHQIDRDGFDKPNYFGIQTFNLIED